MPLLGINIDHVATVREARKTCEPDPVWAAALVELAGADGITIHLREDRRHIQDADVYAVREQIQTRFNLEMANHPEIVEIEEVTPAEITEVEEIAPIETTEFIGVGSEGEAGSGAPGPASYEGRVFSAIRRNFRTSVNPSQSYQISFTVNLDGSHSHEVLRTSGDSSFDRAVTHALNSASIPPVPPSRTSSVNLQIEFFGPDSQ